MPTSATSSAGTWSASCACATRSSRIPQSYFHRYAALDEAEARATAAGIWNEINGVNLRENIAPTRMRAHLILRKGANHDVEQVQLRRL